MKHIKQNHESRPVGRPSLGITKKVSLTLTEEEWAEIEGTGGTVAAFLKDKMKQNVPEVTGVRLQRTEWESERTPVAYSLSQAEERWNIYLQFSNELLPDGDIIDAAKQSMFQILYPNQVENVFVETREQYVCPFTGKRFGSMDKLVSAAIPTIIQWAIAKKRRDTERATQNQNTKKNL